MFDEIIFQLSKRRLIRSNDQSPAVKGGSSTAAYVQWRDDALENEFRRCFDIKLIQGKDILDLGCGTGGLTFLLIELGAKSCVGIDLSHKDIEIANSKLTNQPIVFQCASNTETIDLSDQSVDVVACFDVMEHIIEYRSIINEWRRVLRPGGRVLISWQPWFHPYGHHARGYIPIPWAHVFLKHRQRIEICARIVDLPEFEAPWWDRDENGNTINRFRDALKNRHLADKSNFLNELTMSRFERICQDSRLAVERRIFQPFNGPAITRWLSHLLSQLPGIREFFTSKAIYILKKEE
ncbi:MAG: class I SAM-dependent methyltransferase [Candidatus Accumulibacter sp.]|nr:class I SAM-dependent methyltransferase [Accumulibacter sp.]